LQVLPGLAGRQFADEAVVVIADRVEGIEGISVIRCERKAFLDAQGQIGVCHEVTSEGHGIGDAVLDGGFCGFGLEASGCDDLAPENSPKLLGSDRTLSLMDGHVSFYAWLDDVQVSAPLQNGIRFLQHPLPATPTACLAAAPAQKGGATGLPCSI